MAMSAGFVRAATVDDAAAIARVQSDAWAQRYALLLPEQAGRVAELEDHWRALLAEAGGSRVLVATTTPHDAGEVVGVLLTTPPTDPDLADGCEEIAELAVDPVHAHAGHGSRLLAAWADLARLDGVRQGVIWVDQTATEVVQLCRASGFAADGARRTLDLHGDGAVVIALLRLHCDVGADDRGPAT